MRVRVALALALALAGCGKQEDRANEAVGIGANGTNDGAAVLTPIVENRDADAVPVEDAVLPMPQPRRSPPASHDDAYRAIGTEPFWTLTIRDGRATLTRPDRPPLPVGALIRTDDDRAIRYQGEGFTATVTPGPCGDGMSEPLWSDRVQIAFADGTLKGCGGVREEAAEE